MNQEAIFFVEKEKTPIFAGYFCCYDLCPYMEKGEKIGVIAL